MIHFKVKPILNKESKRCTGAVILMAKLKSLKADDTRIIGKAEKAVQLQEAAFNNFAFALIISDDKGKVLWINKSFTALTGFELTEIIGQKTGQYQKSDCQNEAFYKNLWDTCLSGEIWQGELINKRKDGSLYPEEMTVTPLKDAGNKVTHMVAVKIDLTGKKEAEKRQHKNDKINKALLNAIPDILFRIDKKGTYLDVFTLNEKGLLTPKKKLLGKRLTEVLQKDTANEFIQNIGKALKSGELIESESEITINNKTKIIETRIVAISPEEVFLIARNITKRKKTEKALNSTLQHLGTLMEHMHAGTIFTDLDHKILLVNHKLCEFFGIKKKPDELIGINDNMVTYSAIKKLKNPEGFLSRLTELYHKGETVIGEEISLKDGRWFEFDYVAIKVDGNLTGHLRQYRDITRRKNDEKYRRLIHELEFELAKTTSLNKALNITSTFFQELDNINGFALYLKNFKNDNFNLTINSGWSENYNDNIKQITPTSCIYKIIDKGIPTYGESSELRKDWHQSEKENLKLFGVIPIKNVDQITGAVGIIWKSMNQPDKEQKNFLETVTSNMGAELHRIQMQTVLLQNKKNFQLMFESIEDFVFIMDTDGNIITTNPIVQKRLGYSAKELQNMSVFSIHPSDVREGVAYLFSKMQEKHSINCPFPLRTKSGTEITVETRIVKGEWDGQQALYALSRDLTKRVKIEQELRESKARWQFALEASGDGIWDWNIKTGNAFYSDQWKKMLGFEENEISNNHLEWESRVHPEDRKNALLHLKFHFNEETEIFENEHRLLCKNGEYLWTLARGKVISRDRDGNPERMIGTQKNISAGRNWKSH